jgi:hypothetical protein
MDQHAQDSKVQAVACSSLAMIALNSRESKTRFQETGVIKRSNAKSHEGSTGAGHGLLRTDE